MDERQDGKADVRGLAPERVEVHRIDSRARRDFARGRLRNHAALRFGAGERDFKVDVPGHECALLEYRAHLGRGEQREHADGLVFHSDQRLRAFFFGPPRARAGGLSPRPDTKSLQRRQGSMIEIGFVSSSLPATMKPRTAIVLSTTGAPLAPWRTTAVSDERC